MQNQKGQPPLWVNSSPHVPGIQLPLYPGKRTQVGHRASSGLCQIQTHVLHQISPFDNLVGAHGYVRSDKQPGTQGVAAADGVAYPPPNTGGAPAPLGGSGEMILNLATP